MGKLPKELQEKKRQAQALRTHGGAPAGNQGGAGGKSMNRQMRRRMKSQGIEGMDQIEATKVTIETTDGNLIIENPQVIKLNQQGMEIYQVIGKAKQEGGEGDEEDEDMGDENEEGKPISGSAPALSKATAIASQPAPTPTLTAEITQQDIELVAMQTGVSLSEAEKSLKNCGGDLARAILELKSK